jgi:tyrosyl-tRNA synthetase
MNDLTNDTAFPGIWEELVWRGLVKATTDETELAAMLNGESIAFYCGFDPTAASLHVGNLSQILLMRRLQLAGHQPLALVGGSTGLIGDPRPTAERTLNDESVVQEWADRLHNQITRILTKDGDNGVVMVNNMDWFGQVNAIDFLRDSGKFFRVNNMLKRDAVKTRLESDAGISFTEFAYQILQANDFLHLAQNHGCVLQTGGSDQWGNILGGVDLVKRVTGETVHALGTPLVLNSDGTKFGKSEGNAIWLDPEMLSPFEFFQFWLNTSDDDVVDRLKTFTFLTQQEIWELEVQVVNTPHLRTAQKTLAHHVTTLVHGAQAADDAVAASAILFSGAPLDEVKESTLGLVAAELGAVPVTVGANFLNIIMDVGFVESLSEARRLMKQNGFAVNGEKLADMDAVLTSDMLLFGKFLVLKKGKKQMAVGTVAV